MGSIQGKISPSTGKSWVHRSKCCPSFLSAFVVRRATECSLGSLVQAARAAVCPSSLPNHASGLPSLAHLLERMSSAKRLAVSAWGLCSSRWRHCISPVGTLILGIAWFLWSLSNLHESIIGLLISRSRPAEVVFAYLPLRCHGSLEESASPG